MISTMSLDYAIQAYKDITNLEIQCPRKCRQSCNMCIEEHKQLIEWLEELKELRRILKNYIDTCDNLKNYLYDKEVTF